ncbi:hypothetical protein GCM10010844_39500 [Deinococcus radiotolerans]|uniref:Transposase n=1 Tax=Deinococcus radiotolerans TaxID=1309407 RepID=A0ABQ2FQI3_9DEIO|nr:hypothetical protein GCM10010844_39500 [Deinococcus radiotolerans]
MREQDLHAAQSTEFRGGRDGQCGETLCAIAQKVVELSWIVQGIQEHVFAILPD